MHRSLAPKPPIGSPSGNSSTPTRTARTPAPPRARWPCSPRTPVSWCSEHQETGVLGEQGHLALGGAGVRAVRVGVDEFPDGEPIGGFGASDRCMGGHGESSSLVSVTRPAANGPDARPMCWLIPRLLWMMPGWR